MSSKDYLPQSNDQFDTWEENFATKLPLYNAQVSVTAAEVAAITAAITTHRTAFAAQVSAEASYHAAVQDNKAKKKAEVSNPGALRSLVKKIKSSANYTLQIGQDLGIESIDVPLNLDELKPFLKLFKNADGSIRITWKKGSVAAINIYSKRGDETTFTLLATVMLTSFKDARPNLNGAPEKREYFGRLVYKDVEVGQQSDVASITVG